MVEIRFYLCTNNSYHSIQLYTLIWKFSNLPIGRLEQWTPLQKPMHSMYSKWDNIIPKLFRNFSHCFSLFVNYHPNITVNKKNISYLLINNIRHCCLCWFISYQKGKKRIRKSTHISKIYGVMWVCCVYCMPCDAYRYLYNNVES